jgi:hypothetical protein
MGTLGDALANVKIERRIKSTNSVSPMDRRYGSSMPKSSSISEMRSPMTTVNVQRGWPKLDPEAKERNE